MSADVDPRATAWCAKCHRNLPMRSILHEWAQLPDEARGVRLPEDARYVRGRLRCGHDKAVITSVRNVAQIRERIAKGKELYERLPLPLRRPSVAVA